LGGQEWVMEKEPRVWCPGTAPDTHQAALPALTFPLTPADTMALSECLGDAQVGLKGA
jgi:hypothetical protein